MILSLLIFVIAIIGFVVRKNKYLNFIFLALLLYAVYRDTGNADYLGYVNDYQDANFEEHVSDPLYYLLVKFFANLGIPFELFRLLFFFFYFFVLHKLISSRTKHELWVWVLFATSVFCLHVVWMRYSMAFMLIYHGLFLYYYSGKKILAYVSFIMAVFFHFGVVVCFPLLFIGEMGKKKFFVMLAFIFVATFFLSNLGLLSFFELVSGDERAGYIERNYLSQEVARSGVYKIIESILTIICVYYVLQLERKKVNRFRNNSVKQKCISDIELIQRFNMYSIVLVPLINIAEPIARYFMYIYPVYLIVFTYYYTFDKEYKLSSYDLLVLLLTIGVFVSFVGISGMGYEYGFKSLFQ